MLNRILPYITMVFVMVAGLFTLSVITSTEQVQVASADGENIAAGYTLEEVVWNLYGVTPLEAREGKSRRGHKSGHNRKGGDKHGDRGGYGQDKKKDKNCKPKKKKKKEKKKKEKKRESSKRCKCPFNLILKPDGRCYNWFGAPTNWRPKGNNCPRQPVYRQTPIPVYEYQTGQGGG